MMMQMLCRAETRLQTQGGASRSLFPAVEKVLNSSETQKMLFGDDLISTNAYESLMDALFCELFVEWQEACEAYYTDDGPPLRAVISDEERQGYEAALVAFVELVRFYRMLGEEHSLRWLRAALWDLVPRPTLR